MKARLWTHVLALALMSLGVAVADEAARLPAAFAPLIQHVSRHPDGQAPNSLDFAALKGDRSSLPIGVFDSGIGGLTVLEAILKQDSFNNATLQPGADGTPDFAGEKFIYLGDQANMPYGNYPSKGKEDFLRELIVKDAVFLLGKRYHAADGPRFDKAPVKAIVIACNTATAYGIDDIRAALKTCGLDVPVIGVVEAGARAVVEQLPSGGKAPAVGVLATVGTCASGAYPRAISRAAGLAGKAVPLVVQQGSAGLAGAIEGNPAYVWSGAGERPLPYAGPEAQEAWNMVQLAGVASPTSAAPPAPEAAPGGAIAAPVGFQLNSPSIYATYEAAKLVTGGQKEIKNWVQKGGAPLSIMVLGCTHYPLVEKELAGAMEYMQTTGVTKGIESGVIGKTVFINPAEHTAKELFRELARARLRVQPGSTPPTAEFFMSVPNPAIDGVKLAGDGSLDGDYKVGRSTGHPEREDTKVIRLTAETLPTSSKALLQKLPAVWAQMGGEAPKDGSARLRGPGGRLRPHAPGCLCPQHVAGGTRRLASDL